jgi:hypothetical protein
METGQFHVGEGVFGERAVHGDAVAGFGGVGVEDFAGLGAR